MKISYTYFKLKTNSKSQTKKFYQNDLLKPHIAIETEIKIGK